MRAFKHFHLSLAGLLYVAVTVLSSCANEMDPFAIGQKTGEGTGTFEVSLEGNSVTRATTKVSEAEAKKFLITIYKGEDVFTPATPLGELSNRLNAGYGYSLYAQSCTEEDAESANEGWGKRRYEGKSQPFAVIAGETTKVSIPCKVANGGISAYFDKTVTDNFTDYSITITEGTREIVFDASNSDKKNGEVIDKGAVAYFNIPEAGRTVSYTVKVGSVTKTLTQELAVAQIRRLSVAYKSGSFTLEINVNDEEIFIEDNVVIEPDPTLSSDKIPEITTQNVYENGVLVGTTLSATEPAYDTEWTAVVKNGNGVTVRTLSSAKGTLTSGADDAEWPYLPTGNYALEYTYENFKGIVETKTKTFNITEQPNFQVSLNALTSYSYAVGDGTTKNITQANACENNKIYAPTVTVTGISDALIEKYGLTSTFNNVTKEKSKTAVFADYTVSELKSYDLSASATFCGRTINAAKTVHITGIPYTANPPKQDNGWSKKNGGVDWGYNDHVRLGNGTAGEQRISKSFYVPGNVDVSAYVKADTHGSVVGTTFTFNIGGQGKITSSVSGTGDKSTDTTVSGTLTTSNSTIECINSYGMGLTHTKVYIVTVNYR